MILCEYSRQAACPRRRWTRNILTHPRVSACGTLRELHLDVARGAVVRACHHCIHWRPYRVERNGSLPTSEVKRRRARLVLGWGTAREGCKICTCPMTTERHGQAHGQRILSYVGPATFCCQGSSVKVWPFRPWSRKAQRCRRSVPKPFGASKLGGPSSTAHILDLLSVRSLP